MDILTAIRNGDVSIIETTRSQVRLLQDRLPEGDLGDQLMDKLEDAQGEADEPGKVAYVVLKIQGETL